MMCMVFSPSKCGTYMMSVCGYTVINLTLQNFAHLFLLEICIF